MKKVQVIEATKNKLNRGKQKEANLMRVAPYCRVSTDSEEQLLSYNSQVQHYKNLVESKPGWELVDIYADEGISGTQTANRAEFQRMINDAIDGKIDIIITKSISRFARNTVDTLKYVRLLKEKNVGIIFEKENIDTMSMNGELLLTILSSLAQQESESISANVKMGIKMKMKRGEMTGFNGCLGYDYHPEDKTITVNEEEAEIVRYIFQRYIDGIGCSVIAKELTARGAKTKRGSTTWGESTVRGIIKNEKYKGDLLLGKTYTVDPISHRRLDNLGEEDQYYVSNHHEPIISAEVFEKAQQIMKMRGRKSPTKGKRQKYSRKYAFSSKIKCGYCGASLTRRKWHSGTDHEKYVWQCMTFSKHGRQACEHSKGLDEKIIEEAYIRAYNYMVENNREVINEFIDNLDQTLATTTTSKDLKEVKKRIQELESEIKNLVDLKIKNIIDENIYSEKYSVLKEELDGLKEEQKDYETKLYDEKTLRKRIEIFRKRFNSEEKISTFSRKTFEEMVDHIVMGDFDENREPNPYKMTFIFHTGWKEVEDGKKFKDPIRAYSNRVHDTRGDGGIDVKSLEVRVLKDK